MFFLKKIWRLFLKRYENSRLHVFVSRCLQAIEFDGFVLTYSQFGEDMILMNFFRDQKSGYYVDVGANRPIQGSNTFKLYLKGWRGINIDANADLINQFNKVRKRDINLCEIISSNQDPVTFHLSVDDRVSTVSAAFKDSEKNKSNYSRQVTMVPKSLESILDAHLPANTKIDFMSIDVEGYDYEVLISNNFLKYRPYVICIEDHDFSFDTFQQARIYQFLTMQGYQLKGYAYPNMFFEDSK